MKNSCLKTKCSLKRGKLVNFHTVNVVSILSGETIIYWTKPYNLQTIQALT